MNLHEYTQILAYTYVLTYFTYKQKISTNYVKAFRLLSKMVVMHLDLNYFTSSLCEVFGFVIRNIYIRHDFPINCIACLGHFIYHEIMA